MYRKHKPEEDQFLDGTYVIDVKKLSPKKQEEFYQELEEKESEDRND